MNRRLRVVLATLAAVAVASLFALGMPAQADEKVYAHVESASSGDVTLTVSYDDPIAGQPLTLHVAADGGSGTYKYICPLRLTPTMGSTSSQLWTPRICQAIPASRTLTTTSLPQWLLERISSSSRSWI